MHLMDQFASLCASSSVVAQDRVGFHHGGLVNGWPSAAHQVLALDY